MPYKDPKEQKEYYAQYRAKNIDEINQKAEIRRKKHYQEVLKAKDRPCMDCGKRFPPYVMDLDHVRGEKEFAVSHFLSTSLESLRAEIAKCDVVCSNCHRIRTWARKGFPWGALEAAE